LAAFFSQNFLFIEASMATVPHVPFYHNKQSMANEAPQAVNIYHEQGKETRVFRDMLRGKRCYNSLFSGALKLNFAHGVAQEGK
jgi:hypothetical protein